MLKTCGKRFYKTIRVVLCKKPLQKTPNIGEMRRFLKKRTSCKGYSPFKGSSLCKIVSLGQELKMPKTCEKLFYNIRFVLCKGYSPCKGYSLYKIVSLGQKLKLRKMILKQHQCCSVQKTARKKSQILEKSDDFENWPSGKSYSPRKGYSLFKMVSLGQKLKMPKTCEKRFYKNITVVLSKKPLKQTPNNGEMRRV